MRTVVNTLSEERSDLHEEPIPEPPSEKRSDIDQEEKRPKLYDPDVSPPLPAKRRVEETPEGDRRRQAKRPREKVDDKDLNLCVLAKRSTEEEVDDGLTDLPPFVNDKDSNSKGDIEEEEEEEEEEDYGEEYDHDEDDDEGFARRKCKREDFFDVGDFSEDEDEDWGGCDACVPEQICGVCGYKDGIPPKCPYCGKDGDYLMCRIGPFLDNWDNGLEKLQELHFKLGLVDSGNVPVSTTNLPKDPNESLGMV
ncbi:hypothetical protein OROGR_006302 [Orobanche gracilis]